ncbi:MAG: hypothetical protein IKD47_00040 [Clostridia bacterium]|nr:hypothetical protein [Clostridia bacterium]
MEEQVKQEVLSKLYTLRTGMALLSIEKDKINRNKAQLKNEDSSLRFKQREIEKVITDNRKEIKRMEKEKNNEEIYLQKIPSFWVERIISIIGGILLILFSICLGYWFYLVCRVDLGKEAEQIANLPQDKNPIFHVLHLAYIAIVNWMLSGDFFGFLALAFLLVTTVGTLVTFILGIMILKGDFFFEIRDKWMVQNSINDLKKKIDVLREDNRCKEKALEKIKIKSQLEIQKIDKKTQEYYQEAQSLYNVLKKEFSDFLQIVDWGNIDLLIYYFMTGRADDMKEALQQVDRQRQTEQIETAINNASIQICGTIQKAFSQLQASIAQSFSLLSEQLDLMHQQQMGQLSVLSGRIKELSLEINEGRKNKELQEKLAQRGSLQLAEDIHQLRIYADNKAVKERNGM